MKIKSRVAILAFALVALHWGLAPAGAADVVAGGAFSRATFGFVSCFTEPYATDVMSEACMHAVQHEEGGPLELTVVRGTRDGAPATVLIDESHLRMDSGGGFTLEARVPGYGEAIIAMTPLSCCAERYVNTLNGLMQWSWHREMDAPPSIHHAVLRISSDIGRRYDENSSAFFIAASGGAFLARAAVEA